MQELIDQMWEIAKYGDSYEVAPCIEAAEAMLEKEKEVMCGFGENVRGAMLKSDKHRTTEEVYNETFNTNEK